MPLRLLGGIRDSTEPTPGGWELQHFNRYRATALEATWVSQLPWRKDYLAFCTTHEPDCLRTRSTVGSGQLPRQRSCSAIRPLALASGPRKSGGKWMAFEPLAGDETDAGRWSLA